MVRINQVATTIPLTRIGATSEQLGIEGRWSLQQLATQEEILQGLFPDLGESSYDNWDYQQHDALLAFMNQRMLTAPFKPRRI